MVVCAPTGSGKTVVFEMAIVQLLMKLDDMNYTDDFKIIYMAPVKAVCSERLSEWYPKFTRLGLLCIEVTGDTDVDFSKLQPYRIIITTPEKWDVLTRRWTDYRGLVGVIKLFLIDEVHILNDETRGPTLEAVASSQSAYRIEKLQQQQQHASTSSTADSPPRIRFVAVSATVSNPDDVATWLGTEDSPAVYHNYGINSFIELPNIYVEKLQQQQHASTSSTIDSPPRIRFMAVSATVSNPDDVATWLGTEDNAAVYHKYGDECRPVKLKRIVEGYPCSEGTSIFKFDIILSYKLWPIIQKYYDGKPTLIFCNTRKSVVMTAEALSRELTITFNPEQKAKLMQLASNIKNKKLQSLVMNGVGLHHAGLLYEERVSIEQGFRQRDLPILITTTTLGMNYYLFCNLFGKKVG
ncbi:hypothetical protein JYU34_006048 [Plutella xylostella]|uniref:Helicase ATP-binding domain-containing protein n=1 Tax=Plutella xylostella TaxID=51655 RepID=A0ABQ7QUU9_PLUXY|nr:hypothetical protein JYU34_006048 [Plutella xylostella]